MNRSLLFPWAIGLLIMSFVTSCREPKDLVFKEIKNVSVENIGFTDAILKVELQYYNPNNFGLELNRTDLDLYIDSTYLGHSAQNIQIAIPKRDVFTIPLEVKLDIKNLLKNGLNSLFSKEISIRLLGKVKVGKAGVYKNFNVDYTTKQNFSIFQ